MSRKITNKILKGVLWVIVGLVALLFIIPVLLYIPFVQDFAVKVASTQVEKATGMKVGIEKLRLGFPLRLSVDNAVVIQENGDTMLTSNKLAVNVKLMPLLKGEIHVEGATLDNAFYQMGNNDSLMWIRANINYANIDNSDINLKGGNIDLSKVELDGANIMLRMLEDTTSTTADTTQSTPWKIHADLIRMKDVTYLMSMEKLIDSLGCHIGMAQLCNGNVDMSTKKIFGRSLRIDSVRATYLYPIAELTDSTTTASDTISTPSSDLWTITADSLRLTANEALYAESGHTPIAGFDPSYIQGRNIIIEVDSFYNRGTSIIVPVKKISATERCGLQLYADGTFKMDEKSMKATDFSIETLKSNLYFSAEMGVGDLMTDKNLPLSLKGSGRIDPKEVSLAFPDMRQMLAPFKPLSFSTDIDGTSGLLNVYNIDMILPDIARIKAEGEIDNPFSPDKIGGELSLEGSLSTITDKQFSFLPIKVVPALRLEGDVKYHPGNVEGDVTVTTRQGRLAAGGKWNGKKESYNATVNLDRFPVDAFMSELGIGEITASLKADGVG